MLGVELGLGLLESQASLTSSAPFAHFMNVSCVSSRESFSNFSSCPGNLLGTPAKLSVRKLEMTSMSTNGEMAEWVTNDQNKYLKTYDMFLSISV